MAVSLATRARRSSLSSAAAALPSSFTAVNTSPSFKRAQTLVEVVWASLAQIPPRPEAPSKGRYRRTRLLKLRAVPSPTIMRIMLNKSRFTL